MRESDGNRTLRELLRIVFQHWVMLFVIVTVVAGGTLAYCLTWAKPIYRSEVELVFMRPANKNPLTADTPERALEVFVKAQQQIVMSDLVMARTIALSEDAGLRKQWYDLRGRLAANGAPADGSTLGPDDGIEAIQTDIDTFLDKGDVANKVRRLMERNQKSLKRFRDSVDLETPGGEHVALTESFTIQVDREGPWGPAGADRARTAADLLADMYMVRHRQIQQSLNEPAVRVMKSVVDTVDTEVREKQDAYEAFVQTHAADVGVLEQLVKSGAENGVQVMLTKVREADARLQLEAARVRAIRDVSMASLPAGAVIAEGLASLSDGEIDAAVRGIPAELLDQNSVLRTMRGKVASLEARRARIVTQFTPESRNVRYMDEELREIKRQAAAILVSHINGLTVTLRSLEEQQIENAAILGKITAEHNKITKNLAQYARLKNEMEVAQVQLAGLEKQYTAARANSMRAREAVTIDKLSQASMPDPLNPRAPKAVLYTLVALVVSLLMGIALAFLADHFDHTLHSIDEAERYLGIPVVGSVKKHGRGVVMQA